MDYLFSVKELSELISVPVSTLNNHRSQKKGIPFIRLTNGIIRYRESEIRRYLEQNRVDTVS